MSYFSDYIQQFKSDLNLSSRDLAEIMGVGTVTFENYLSGYSRPSQRAMERLVRTLALESDDVDGSFILPNEKLPFETCGLDLAAENMTVRVSGDGMAEHGLRNGSVVTIDRKRPPRSGDILFMELNGEPCFRAYDRNGDVTLSEDGGSVTVSEKEFAEMKVYGYVTSVTESLEEEE